MSSSIHFPTFSRYVQHQQVRERIWIVSLSFMFWVLILFALSSCIHVYFFLTFSCHVQHQHVRERTKLSVVGTHCRHHEAQVVFFLVWLFLFSSRLLLLHQKQTVKKSQLSQKNQQHLFFHFILCDYNPGRLSCNAKKAVWRRTARGCSLSVRGTLSRASWLRLIFSSFC